MTLQTIVFAFAIFVIAQTHEVLLFGSCVRRLSCVRLRRKMQNILTSGIVLALAQGFRMLLRNTQTLIEATRTGTGLSG